MPGLEGFSFGPYYLKQSLGQGGMAEVYLADDEERGIEVAVKVIGSNNVEYLERFRREAKTIDLLRHEHILSLLEYGDQEPWHYLVMPYVPDGTLHDRIASGPLSVQESGIILEQITSALQYAHNRGIIHRDIKPSNILFASDDYVYLADFGLAKVLDADAELTRTGLIMGTPEYMAPDLADGPATRSTDIYALGVLLYEMLTGQPPFTAPTALAVYWKHIRELPQPPSQVDPSLPSTIDDVVLCALEKDPAKRFQSVTALFDAYQAALMTVAAEHAEEEGELDRQAFEEAMSQPEPSRPDSLFAQTALHRRGDQLILRPAEHGYSDKALTSLSRHSSLNNERLDETAPLLSPSGSHSTSSPRRSFSSIGSPRRKGSISALSTFIIVAGLLIFIVFPMGYIYYLYSTQPEPALVVNAAHQSTVVAIASPTSKAGGVLVDSLAKNTGGRWDEDALHCFFKDGTYHAIATQEMTVQPCPLLQQQFTNGSVQVDVSLLAGTSASLLLRQNGEQFYEFGLTNRGQIFFLRHDRDAGDTYISLLKPFSSTVLRGGMEKNTLQVIALKDDFKLFLNGVQVGEVYDATYAEGQIALAAATPATIALSEGSFSAFKLTAMP
ncbi:serine/threonine protein kinase [Tengunoibacter tsumagoiensis]|uniref:non-specific serine/threonine protein kinase n=1 Tax=Tengunoibacter tsumagoiensis TaxID=2014871 RepID=A0A401ZVK3_9CHLR|nr:serine/threonine-protein kinase [Tengunoibacter tsumagoiensis]GCE10923.1 hypothetical protein KTT_07820 [Tengunoibacter tsumagoiensis]